MIQYTHEDVNRIFMQNQQNFFGGKLHNGEEKIQTRACTETSLT